MTAGVIALGKNNPQIISYPHLAKTSSAETNALVATTVANWMIVADWNTDEVVGRRHTHLGDPQDEYPAKSMFSQFVLDLTCDAAETLTGTPKLYSARLFPITIADDTFTASGADLTATTHAFLDGDGPVRVSSDGTPEDLPAGLASGTDYFVEVQDANTIRLHTTRKGAIESDANTLITTTDAGTGTHTIADVQSSVRLTDDTRRFHLCLLGDLNDGSDIALTSRNGYHERINHDPLTWAYAVVATQTNTETLSMRATPVHVVEV